MCLGSLGRFPQETTLALGLGGREFRNQSRGEEFLSTRESSEIPRSKAGAMDWELWTERRARDEGGESTGWRGADSQMKGLLRHGEGAAPCLPCSDTHS